MSKKDLKSYSHSRIFMSEDKDSKNVFSTPKVERLILPSFSSNNDVVWKLFQNYSDFSEITRLIDSKNVDLTRKVNNMASKLVVGPTDAKFSTYLGGSPIENAWLGNNNSNVELYKVYNNDLTKITNEEYIDLLIENYFLKNYPSYENKSGLDFEDKKNGFGRRFDFKSEKSIKKPGIFGGSKSDTSVSLYLMDTKCWDWYSKQ